MASALSHIVYIAVTNKHTAKLHHVGSLYTLTYDARKLRRKKLMTHICLTRMYIAIRVIIETHYISWLVTIQFTTKICRDPKAFIPNFYALSRKLGYDCLHCCHNRKQERIPS